jgi:4-diphosphocytidyl-2-C-methyl-D-erythritol kinase
MRAEAYAKVNLALVVFPPMADGYHPIRGIFQSVSLADDVEILPSACDAVIVSNREAPGDDSNLGWRAFDAARRTARITQPAELRITKRIPVGAGLGGGSADAGAALGLAADRFGIDEDQAFGIAEGIGADVPFSFLGGTCLVEGRGERLTRLDSLQGFALAIVVPPFAMATSDVYVEWDRLDGPEGEGMDDADVPPSLRSGPVLRNDLYPAALSLDERLGDWRSDLERRWGTSVAMTGSGSALFAFFSSADEANGAAAAIDLPTRLSVAVDPVSQGWRRIDD